jgi:stearoyl-CoA desaturase (delta-9 desaturase)
MNGPTSSSKGPLGPTWQPIYDGMYSILMLTFDLPHLAVLTVIGLILCQFYGYLHITPLMPLVSVFAMARVPFVGCCMSICLHRYFAHNAFSTSRPFQFVLGIVGSMAIQGGVLWWASKHLRHHKHCDTAKDPHSPTQTSEMYAWLWWMYYETHHDWVYLPKRLLTPEMLLINLLFPFPNALLTLALVPYLGKEWALFVCWVPGIFGALATTRFNVEYHPPHDDHEVDECIGINKESGDKGIGPLRLEWLAVYCPWMFEPLVGEAFHLDHHEHPRRAHRPGYDVPYTLVLKPLADLGIIWDLQQPLPNDDWEVKGKVYPIVAEKSS